MRKLEVSRFALAEHVNQTHAITVEAGTTLDDVMQPEFLANVAIQLRPYDKIQVRIDTGEYYAELLVLTCGRVWAKTTAIFSIDLTTQDVDMSQADAMEKYLIQFRGPHLKFCIIRKDDKETIKEQLQTKAEAQAWLASFAATI